MTEQRTDEASYYHARAADMMAKAQAAPSKAVRAAYLNLARVWVRKAANLEKEEPLTQTPDDGPKPESAGAEQKK
jgi:hypothetical protein